MTIYERLKDLEFRVSLLENPTGTRLKIAKQQDGEILNTDKLKRFVKPTLEEVKHYFEQIGVTQSDLGQKFIDFYESKGWKIGKTPMKDWKAACRTWKNNGFRSNQSKETEQREIAEIIERKRHATK